jgi:radical SAM protein with 4Fe4S-binding SPASM domain
MGISNPIKVLTNPEGLKNMMFLRRFWLRRLIPMDFPYIINIEPTNNCNLKCVMCARQLSERQVGSMDMDLYRQIIDESVDHGRRFRIFLVKDGEPLLHPRLPEMVEYAKVRRAARAVTIISNGISLNQDLAQDLIQAGLDDLTISIDAVSAEQYSNVKGVDGLAKVEDNIQGLMELRKKFKTAKPFLRVRMVQLKQNMAEVEAFKEKWGKTADAVDITEFHSWTGAVEDMSPNGQPRLKRYPCPLLWYTGVINWDGSVSLCCIDYNCKGIVGNVKQQSLRDIWNGEKLRQVRRNHLDAEYDQVEICANCEYWSIKEDIGDWLRRKQYV